jgi:glycosyltransferase involved in cell wall biosynthesis
MQINYPIISIVTPSFNQEKFLERTILSVISQEGNFYLDYIIMDGDSTDESIQIIKKYFNLICFSHKIFNNQSSLNFFKIKDNTNYKTKCLGISFRWFSEKDKGQANAINKGWKLSAGSIIAWLNSDDVYLDGSLKKITNHFLENNSIHCLYGIGVHIDSNDKLLEMYPIETYSWNRLIDYCYICQPTVFLRKEILDTVGYLNENLNYCMDYEFWLRIGKLKDFYFFKKILACTRIHELTKTSQNLKVHSEIIKMQINLLGKVSYHWLYYYSYYNSVKILSFLKNNFIKKLIITLYFRIIKIKFFLLCFHKRNMDT